MDKGRINKRRTGSDTLSAILMVGPVTFVMVVLVAIPLIYVAVMSFCSIDEFYNVTFELTMDNYIRLMDVDYMRIYARSLFIAFVTTILCILTGYPFAYIIARTRSRRKKVLYMLVIIPFWTNSLIRIYGWRSFLGTNGWLNSLLIAFHVTDEPMDIVSGVKKGRDNKDEIIMCSIGGMPLEDLSWGYDCYERARMLGIGTKLNLWDEPYMK